MYRFYKSSSLDFKISILVLIVFASSLFWIKFSYKADAYGSSVSVNFQNLLAEVSSGPTGPDAEPAGDSPDTGSLKTTPPVATPTPTNGGGATPAAEPTSVSHGSSRRPKTKPVTSTSVDTSTTATQTAVDSTVAPTSALNTSVSTGTSHSTDAQSPTSQTGGGFSFNQNLQLGMKNDDVVELQKVLRSEGFLQYSQNTGYFGLATYYAVLAYQRAHFSEIQYATGYVGPLTRAVLNK